MRKKFDVGDVVMAAVIAIIISGIVIFAVTKRSMQTKYLKAALVTPSPQWIDLHGPSLESWQVFNENLIVNTLKKMNQPLEARKND